MATNYDWRVRMRHKKTGRTSDIHLFIKAPITAWTAVKMCPNDPERKWTHAWEVSDEAIPGELPTEYWYRSHEGTPHHRNTDAVRWWLLAFSDDENRRFDDELGFRRGHWTFDVQRARSQADIVARVKADAAKPESERRYRGVWRKLGAFDGLFANIVNMLMVNNHAPRSQYRPFEWDVDF